MKLLLMERFQLLQILPMEGSRLTGKIVSEFIKKLQPNVEEMKRCQIKEGGQIYVEPHTKRPIRVPEGQVMYEREKDKPTEIEINDIILDIIKKTFKQMDETKKLPLYLNNLYDRFMEPEVEKSHSKAKRK